MKRNNTLGTPGRIIEKIGWEIMANNKSLVMYCLTDLVLRKEITT